LPDLLNDHISQCLKRSLDYKLSINLILFNHCYLLHVSSISHIYRFTCISRWFYYLNFLFVLKDFKF
jgi:hypothetical protein